MTLQMKNSNSFYYIIGILNPVKLLEVNHIMAEG